MLIVINIVNYNFRIIKCVNKRYEIILNVFFCELHKKKKKTIININTHKLFNT